MQTLFIGVAGFGGGFSPLIQGTKEIGCTPRGHATARFLEGSLKEVLLRRVLGKLQSSPPASPTPESGQTLPKITPKTHLV